MERLNFTKYLLSQFLVVSFLLTSCTPTDVASTRGASAAVSGKGINGTKSNVTDDVLDSDDVSVLPKVEIRHLIEPNLSYDTTYSSGTGYAGGGSYIRKLTLPKNFAGRLYVAGINIGTLASRFVRVRFKFGMNQEPVIINATVAQAPGISSGTAINVLVLDLRSEPFRAVRLPYDLFDYNDYGNFENNETPVQDNRDSGLYCRGLKLADDPTFDGIGQCDSGDEQCLYAYAKVMDQGLVKETTVKLPLTPTLGQNQSFVGSDYYKDYFSSQLLKPLPDMKNALSSDPNSPDHYKPASFLFSEVSGSTSSPSMNFLAASIWSAITPVVNGPKYYYRGPYRLVNMKEWEFDFPNLDGENKLFRANSFVMYPNYLTQPLVDDSQTSPVQNKIYYQSYMFPLATKLQLGAGVAHLSSEDVLGPRSPTTLTTAGTTNWMDGSNARARSRNTDQEHVGSCNVTATMEILAKDENNVEYIVATSNDVKLQLVRPTTYRTDVGDEVLYSNFKSCSSNSSCGSSSCCFNGRCWDQNLVSQCIDTSSSTGNKGVGSTCGTDLECSSLCCNSTTGQCAPHNTALSPAVTCSKAPGSFCISKEWCSKSSVTKAILVKLTPAADGTPRCQQLTYSTSEYGECKNSVCVPPTQAVIDPNPDLSGANACNTAVTAPNF